MINLYRETDAPKESFSTPWNPYLPCLGMISNCALAGGVPLFAWATYGVWILVGVGIYLVYGFHNSKIGYSTENQI
jgi:basic amino acid/polyamine antiporter, APA family